MYKSNELIMLKNTDTGEVVRIIPNTEFDVPSGNFINLNEARLCIAGKTALTLRAGEPISGNKPRGKGRPPRTSQAEKPVDIIVPKETPSLLEASNDKL